MSLIIRILGFTFGGILAIFSVAVSIKTETQGVLLFVALSAFMTRLFITKLPATHPAVLSIQLPILGSMIALSLAHAYLLFDLARGIELLMDPLALLLLLIVSTLPVWLPLFVIYAVGMSVFFLFWRKKQQTVR